MKTKKFIKEIVLSFCPVLLFIGFNLGYFIKFLLWYIDDLISTQISSFPEELWLYLTILFAIFLIPFIFNGIFQAKYLFKKSNDFNLEETFINKMFICNLCHICLLLFIVIFFALVPFLKWPNNLFYLIGSYELIFIIILCALELIYPLCFLIRFYLLKKKGSSEIKQAL